jgi:uncharacterized protein YbjT (DUF2867 family)
MILVTTAGKVGAETARSLAEQARPVRILVRDRDAVARWAKLGAEAVVGDLDDPASVDAAMHGISTVALVSPAVPAHEFAVVAGAVKAGVGHLVKVTSKASADSPILRRRNQAAIEQRIAESGIAHTLLRNNAYMQNFLMLAPSIARTGGFSAAAGEGRIGMIDTRDVAGVLAAITAAPQAHAGKTYWPTGPQALSYADAASTFSTILRRPISYRSLLFEAQRDAMVALGLPAGVAADNARALALFATGDADYVTTDVPDLVGRPARTFAQFVTDHSDAFGQVAASAT